MSWFPEAWTHVGMLSAAALLFHTLLWARHTRFLWANRGIILRVVAVAEVWMLITDPIGGWWGAWYFDPNTVLGVWLFAYMPIEDLFGIAVVSSAAACAILVFGYSRRRWI